MPRRSDGRHRRSRHLGTGVVRVASHPDRNSATVTIGMPRGLELMLSVRPPSGDVEWWEMQLDLQLRDQEWDGPGCWHRVAWGILDLRDGSVLQVNYPDRDPRKGPAPSGAANDYPRRVGDDG